MKFFASKLKTETSEFSRFFRSASSRERKKVFVRAAKKANEDQRKIYYSNNTKKIAT